MNQSFIDIAHQTYTDMKDDFVADFSEFLQERASIGETQIENGDFVLLEKLRK